MAFLRTAAFALPLLLVACAPTEEIETQYQCHLPGYEYGVCLPVVTSNACSDGIKLMTYNLASAANLWVDPGPPLNKVAALVAAESPDAIAFQEVSEGASFHGGANMFQMLKDRLLPLGYEGARYKVAFPLDGGSFGLAIFSKGPILEYDWSEVHDAMNTYAQMIKIDTSCGTVRVFNTHPAPPPNPTCDALSHPTQWDFLDFVASYGDDMSFLLGDFNMTQDFTCYPDFLATHRNGCDESSDPSCNDTVVASGQEIAIDHIFVKSGASAGFANGWRTGRVWADHTINDVDASGVGVVSDHWPVLGIFRY
jgi:endonuclease/exonuclease/phosphatase family metal-dependent hydrolase